MAAFKTAISFFFLSLSPSPRYPMKNLSLFNALLKSFSAFILIFVMQEAPSGGAEPPAREALPQVKLYRLTIPQAEEVIASVSRTRSTIAARIAAYSERALGTPYAADSLGEGSGAACDGDPLMDLGRVDCVTFCEQILALAVSRHYDEAFRNLQRIRYRGGIISFATRNHFVMADWLPHNQWLLKDITADTGGRLCQEMTKTIDRKGFAAARGCTDAADWPQPQRMSIRYIPTRYLPTTAAQLKGSEILVLITAREGIFASHLGFIIKAGDGRTLFRHASSIQKKVVDEPLEHLYRRIAKDRQIAGFALIAAGEEIDQSPPRTAP